MDSVVGIDVGQRTDPTAICVAQTDKRRLPEVEHHFLIRHLERLPLGTAYPVIARRLGEIISGVLARSGRPKVFVDATGVGRPVVDLLRERAPVNSAIIPVTFTYGDRRTEDRGEVRLGKAYLVSRLQALLQIGRLHLPRTSEAEALAEELLDYEIRVDHDANDRYGAFRVGTHDDLVTALGLAVQMEPKTIEIRPIAF